MKGRVLVAGIGNIFLGDDGWGPEVARRLADDELPDGVRVTDFGIRGVHLAYELLEGYQGVVLVDAVDLGEAPGTVTVIAPELPDPATAGDDHPLFDAHRMSPDVVLGLLAGLGGAVGTVRIVGCQPADLAEGIGLSPAVAAAVAAGAVTCHDVVGDILSVGDRPDGLRGDQS